VIDDRILLASCLGDQDTGGGLVAMDGSRTEVIDRMSTTGLTASDETLLRALRSVWHPEDPGELLVYDAKGVARYLRLDEIRNAHDIYWNGATAAVVSTGTNSIYWLNLAGDVVRRFTAPGEGDAWHLNSIVEREGDLYAAAFGQGLENRGWESSSEKASGIVFEIESRRVLISGLSRPHHPRFIDGLWVVCNSQKAEVVGFDESKRRVVRRAKLASWTRGLAASKDFLFIGESRPRGNKAFRRDSFDSARVAVLDRDDWKVVDRLTLQMSEIYDLVLVNPPLVEGLRTGFRTNQQRAQEQDQLLMFREAGVNPPRLWATTDPLPADACIVRIVAEIPPSLSSGAVVSLSCTVTNLGPVILASVPPHPVHISYKWLDPDGNALPGQFEGRRSKLLRPLPPGESVEGQVMVDVAPPPGNYLLRLTLVQEFVSWFDEVDSNNGITMPISVRPAELQSVS
jgi:acetolactate synthase-1/2/3 large subunit